MWISINRKEMIEIGLFEKIFPKKAVGVATGDYFQTLTAYQPRFTSFNGGIYEALLCRSAIHAFALHCSKLKVEVQGGNKRLKKILATRPNPWQTTSQFIYRVATLLETDTTAFIVPILDDIGMEILGFFPVKASEAVVKEHNGVEYLQFTFASGKKAAVEFSRVGVLTKFQYENDLFGGGNRPLSSTLSMIHTQDEGVVNGIKNSAAIRFIATLAGNMKNDTIKEARKQFASMNLTENDSGVLIIDEKYKDVKQIESKALLVDDKQVQQIKNNVYSFFGCNEKILMNDFTEESWNAFYEGKIEPFAIQLSEVLTNMVYSDRELAFDNKIMLSSNRLEYASNSTKLSVVTQLFDRGMMTQNQGLEVFNMPPVKDGDKYFIRKEYAEVDKLNESQGLEPNTKTITDGGTGDAEKRE